MFISQITIVIEEEFRSQIEEEFRSQNQLVGDSDPPLIEDHQIYDLVGVLNPFIHPPVAQNSILNSDS
jgi:hypothetical protein